MKITRPEDLDKLTPREALDWLIEHDPEGKDFWRLSWEKDQQSFIKLAQKFLSVETPPLAGLAA